MRRPSKAIAHTGSASEAAARATGRPVPLDDGVDQAEQQPRGDHRVGVGPDVAVAHRLRHQFGDKPVEGAPLVERGPLDVGVAAHAQQQGDVGRLGFEHLDAAPDEVLQSLDGGRGERPRPVRHHGQAGQGPVQGQPEQFLLARDVVIDRRLRDAEPGRQVTHARAVVTALVEQLDGHGQHGSQVVAGPSAPRPGGRSNGRAVRTGRSHRAHEARPSSWLRPRNSAITSLSRRTVTSYRPDRPNLVRITASATSTSPARAGAM